MASLLETFLYIYDAKTDGLKKGAKEAEKVVDDTADALEEADEQTKELGSSFQDMAKKGLGALAGLVAINAIKQGVISTAEQTDRLKNFSDRLGENMESIDAWSGATVRAGGTAEGFQSSLASLNEKLVETAVKGTSDVLPFFNQMGIAMVDANGKARSTLDILPELADQFDQLSRRESAAIGQKLGLDEGTVALLQQGRGEIDKLIQRQKALGVATKEQGERSAKFVDAMADTGQAFRSVGREIVSSILPHLTDFFDAVTDVIIFFRENKNVVIGFFLAIAGVLAAVYLPAMISAAIATIAAFAPLIMMAALVAAVGAAFALAYDDIAAFLSGNDSIVGELSKKWPIVGEIIKGVAKGIKSAFELIGTVASKLVDFLLHPIDTIKEMIDTIKELSKLSFGDAVSKIFGIELSSDISKNSKAGKLAIAESSSSPINSQTSSSISNTSIKGGNRTVAFTGDVVVPITGGVSDEQAGRATGETIKDQIRRAVDGFNDGLLA